MTASAAHLAARLADAAHATADRRPEPAPEWTQIAMVCPDGFVMCRKPWAVDAWGAISEVCSSKPAHHDGPCGPWMNEPGHMPRDHDGLVVLLDELDYGTFGDSP